MEKIHKELNHKYKGKFENYFIVLITDPEAIAKNKGDFVNFDELCKVSNDLVVLIEYTNKREPLLIVVAPLDSDDYDKIKEVRDLLETGENLNKQRYADLCEETEESLLAKKMFGIEE